MTVRVYHFDSLRDIILDENRLTGNGNFASEEIIFNSYIENNSFTLTQEQRDLAYQSYKETRRI